MSQTQAPNNWQAKAAFYTFTTIGAGWALSKVPAVAARIGAFTADLNPTALNTLHFIKAIKDPALMCTIGGLAYKALYKKSASELTGEEKLEAHNSRLKKVEAKQSEQTGDIDGKLATLTKGQTGLGGRVKTLEEAQSGIKAGFTEAGEARGVLDKGIQRNAAAIGTVVKTTLPEINAKLNTAKSEREGHGTTLGKHTTALTELNGHVTRIDEVLERAKDDRKRLQGGHGDLSEGLASMDQEVKANKALAGGLRTDLTTLQDTVTGHTASLKAAAAARNMTATAVAGLETKIEELGELLGEYAKRIERLETEKKADKKAHTELVSQVTGIAKSLADLEAHFKEGDEHSLLAQFTDLKSELEKTEQGLTKTTATADGFAKQLHDLQALEKQLKQHINFFQDMILSKTKFDNTNNVVGDIKVSMENFFHSYRVRLKAMEMATFPVIYREHFIKIPLHKDSPIKNKKEKDVKPFIQAYAHAAYMEPEAVEIKDGEEKDVGAAIFRAAFSKNTWRALHGHYPGIFLGHQLTYTKKDSSPTVIVKTPPHSPTGSPVQSDDEEW